MPTSSTIATTRTTRQTTRRRRKPLNRPMALVIRQAKRLQSFRSTHPSVHPAARQTSKIANSRPCRIRGNLSSSTRHPLQVNDRQHVDSEPFIGSSYTIVNMLISQDFG